MAKNVFGRIANVFVAGVGQHVQKYGVGVRRLFHYGIHGHRLMKDEIVENNADPVHQLNGLNIPVAEMGFEVNRVLVDQRIKGFLTVSQRIVGRLDVGKNIHKRFFNDPRSGYDIRLSLAVVTFVESNDKRH